MHTQNIRVICLGRKESVREVNVHKKLRTKSSSHQRNAAADGICSMARHVFQYKKFSHGHL
jgi:hypothetical protein